MPFLLAYGSTASMAMHVIVFTLLMQISHFVAEPVLAHARKHGIPEDPRGEQTYHAALQLFHLMERWGRRTIASAFVALFLHAVFLRAVSPTPRELALMYLSLAVLLTAPVLRMLPRRND